MKVSIDTNVILDVLMKRADYQASKDVLELCGKRKIEGYVSASAVTDIYYILYRSLKDNTKTVESIKALLMLIHVADVNEQDIEAALNSGWKDFEDCVQYQVATRKSFQYIITRNTKDFEGVEPKPIIPADFLRVI